MRLMFIDHGDWAEVRPLPDNPIAAARGMLRREGATPSEELRAREVRADAERVISPKRGRRSWIDLMRSCVSHVLD
jgi:hypothetical protein